MVALTAFVGQCMVTCGLVMKPSLMLQREALAFEWAWQHPLKSKAVREMANKLKKREMAGAKGKVCM